MLLPFFLAAAVGTFYLLPALIEPLEEIVEEAVEELEPVQHLQVALLMAAMPVNDYLINADPSERAQFAELRRRVDRAFEKARAAPFGRAENRALVESAEKEWLKARELGESLLQLRRPVGDPQAAAEMKRFDAYFDHAVALLGKVHEVAHQEIEKSRTAAHATKSESRWITFAAFALALAIALYAGTALARSVVAGVEPLRQSAARLAQGELHHRAPSGRADEFGDLAAAFNAMAEMLEKNRASLERRAAQLGALNQIAVAVNSSLQLQGILDEIMRRGIALTGSKAACIAFYDETAGRFTNWVTQGLSEHFVRNMSFRPGGLADETFTTASHVLSNDRPDTRHKLSGLAHEEGLKCFVCLPLTSHERRLGVIYVYRADHDTFAPAEIELLATFASLAAGAIKNARLYARLQEEARTDALTGLSNRREFRRQLDEEIGRARRYSRALALLMLDIDHFKRINDSWGHPAGDEVLRAVAKCILGAIRRTDRAARYGGEEFAVLLPETAARDASTLAERIRAKIGAAGIAVAQGQTIDLTVSIGVAAFPEHAETDEALIAAADQALYAAKQAGRDRVSFVRES